jgi:hypothetical protein
MADVVTFDFINLRVVEITTGGDNSLSVQEIYSEWKQALLDDPSLLGYPQAFRYAGADPISETESLGTTYFLLNGWRIRPAEHSHRLQLVGNLFTDPAGFDADVPTLGTFSTRVNMRLSVLVQSITTEGGGGEADWTTTEKNQIRGALGIVGTQATPAGGGHLQDVRTPVVANIDAAVSSRAVAGDAMTLTSGERGAIADAAWDEPAADHVAAGSMGQFEGRLDAAVTTRATQAQILSDASPFQGARIDAAVSSRAAPGAAMDLIADAVDAGALAASATTEIAAAVDASLVAAHGSGTWQSLTSTQATMLLELYRIMGLDPSRPLVVSETSRDAGAEIEQTIGDAAGTVTVTRI